MTLYLYEKDSEKKENNKNFKLLGFGTKNLPDAMEWHCTLLIMLLTRKKLLSQKKQHIVQMHCYSYLKKNITTYRMLEKN